MAPESERAKCGKQLSVWNPGTGALYCNGDAGHVGDCSYTYFYRMGTYPTPNPNEPTLTCSEVVERLRDAHDSQGRFDPDIATRILHSWRERRVQELEEALRGLLVESIVLTKEYLDTVARGKQDWESVQGWDIARWKRLLAAKEAAQNVLAKSEQIRKGAKHE